MAACLSFVTNPSAWRGTFGRCLALLLATSLLLLSAAGCSSSHSGTSAPAALSYSVTTATYTVGEAITANNPSSTGGTITAYSVSPALPAGLSLDPATGIISGTPTSVTATAAYLVTAANGSGSTTAALSITVTSAPVAPSITTQPGNQRVMLGSTARFTVVASGTAPLTYQWYKDGTAIAGATADWYSLSSAQSTDAASYTVTVTNGTLPDATSSVATLTVDPLGYIALPGGVPLDLAPIAAGTFTMGAPTSESGYTADVTQHSVTLSQPFYMGTYLVTQAQWQALMGNNPSSLPGVSTRPVEQVSWIDICYSTSNASSTEPDGTSFLETLNSATANMRPTGLVFRLPTEAEWEYACRAGTTTSWYWGDSDASIDSYAWYGSNSSSTTHPVGGLLPNAWGLYDMAGNVWEWCQDWFGDYDSSLDTDPVGPTSGTYRILRGGSALTNSAHCRSAYRIEGRPGIATSSLGFRVVLAPPRTLYP